nr:hypothetical protein [Nanoarchaeota archaeon]
MSLEKIPKVEFIYEPIICNDKEIREAYEGIIGNYNFTLFLDCSQEILLRGFGAINYDTWEKCYYMFMNPKVFPPGTEIKYWEPPVAHEMYDLIENSHERREASHEKANEFEASYCISHLTEKEQKRYLDITTFILGKNDSKFKFLEERLG